MKRSTAMARRLLHTLAERHHKPAAPSDPVRSSVSVTVPTSPAAAAVPVVYTDVTRPPVHAGGSVPIIVAIHGAPGSTWDWRWLDTDTTMPGARVIRLECPGHGESPAWPMTALPPSSAAMAAAVWRILDTLLARPHAAAPQPIVLLGHSLVSAS